LLPTRTVAGPLRPFHFTSAHQEYVGSVYSTAGQSLSLCHSRLVPVELLPQMFRPTARLLARAPAESHGLGHLPPLIKDPAIERWYTMRENTHLYFRGTRHQVPKAILLFGLVPVVSFCAIVWGKVWKLRSRGTDTVAAVLIPPPFLPLVPHGSYQGSTAV
jgi:hypothetical protein